MSSGSRALVGLLSEPVRLKVVSALALGAGTPAEVTAATGLDAREVAAALRRLESGGLVSAERGRLRLHEERFKEAARDEAPPPTPDHELSAHPATAAVLRIFAPDGRILSLPSSREKRRLLLEHVARGFEPGVRYPEQEVNAILRGWHDDYAMLRRYLYDGGFLDRKDGEYWRIGGWVDTEPSPVPRVDTEPSPVPRVDTEPPPAGPGPAEPEPTVRVGAYALIERGDEVLLTRLGRGTHAGFWTLPGGGLDFGERPQDGLVREVYEETGLAVRVDELLDVDAFDTQFGRDGERRAVHLVSVLYRATVLDGTLGVTEVDGSTDEVGWFRRDDLPRLTVRAAELLERFTGR